MGTRSGAAAMLLVKWLVVPVLLAALGFFLVGPWLARTQPGLAPVSVQPTAGEQEGAEELRHTKADPQVDVSARRVSLQKSRSRRNREAERKTERNPDRQVPPPGEERSDPEPPPSDGEEPASGGGGDPRALFRLKG